MASRQKVKLEGFKELNEALADFSKATSGNILKRATSAAGAMIAEHAIAMAPKLRGTLKREIKVSKAKIISPGQAAFAKAMRETGDRAIAAAAARNANREAGGSGRAAIVHVGPTKAAAHGQLQEFGTAHQAAQPWLRPTWDAHGREAIDVMKDALAEEIEKAAKRAARKAARIAAKIG